MLKKSNKVRNMYAASHIWQHSRCRVCIPTRDLELTLCEYSHIRMVRTLKYSVQCSTSVSNSLPVCLYNLCYISQMLKLMKTYASAYRRGKVW